jgi:hypothetical protein
LEGKTIPPPNWLMLITNLPGRIPTLRMRIWRALRAAGGGLLRDGVYVLPYSVAARRLFEEQRSEIKKAGGSAYVLPFESDSPEQNTELERLFDRTAEYLELNKQFEAFRRDCVKLSEDEARKRLNAIARDVAELQAIDFFPGKSSKQFQDVLDDAKSSLDALFSPDEPRAAHRKIPRRDRKHFQGRIWATRQHMWIDRVCSAWLIRRFIDRRAKFVWLMRIQDKPKRAIGFDFDGAEYTHVDSKVTFEVLLTSFGLETDAALARLGALVHFLDVGGIPVAEAKGFESIVSGARALSAGDDSLLKQVGPVLDSLYQSFLASDRE